MQIPVNKNKMESNMKKILLAFIFTLLLTLNANAEAPKYGKYSCNYYYYGKDNTCTVYNDIVNGKSSDCGFLTTDIINKILLGNTCTHIPIVHKTYKCVYGAISCKVTTTNDNQFLIDCQSDKYASRAYDDFYKGKCKITY